MPRFAGLLLAIVIVSTATLSSIEYAGALLLPSQSRRLHRSCCGLAISQLAHKRADAVEQLHALSKEQEQICWKLPRLYVGPRHNNNMVNIVLAAGARIPLSSEQAHYLINVMRILKKRKNNHLQSSANDIEGMTIGKDYIRVFNGENGEWLAKVHLLSEEQNESSHDGKGRSKKGGRSIKQKQHNSLIAECIVQIRSQDLNSDGRPSIMFVPLKKQPRMKLLIEKCTELGVGKLIPVASDRMEGGALQILGSDTNESDLDVIYGGRSHARDHDGDNVQLDKLEMQAIEASEQCERLGIPIITSDVGLSQSQQDSSQHSMCAVQDLVKQWCDEWEKGRHLKDDLDANKSGERAQSEDARMEQARNRVLLICRERGSNEGANMRTNAVPVLEALHGNQQVSFLVGPEGGWSKQEEEMFDEICSKYSDKSETPVQCISLGSSVLRAETACMMATGAWSLINDLQ